MLLLIGISCFITGIWLGRKWKNHKIHTYKRYLKDLLQKANQLHTVNKQLAQEVKMHRKAAKQNRSDDIRAGIIEAAAELMVEAS